MAIPEMLQRTNQYVAIEALVAGKREEHKRPRAEPTRGQPPVPPRRRIDRPDVTLPRTQLPPLNSSRMEIFLQIKEKGLLKAPNPMKASHKLRDHSKYYWFHRDYGYDTEECRDLKNQIEELLHREHLGHYIRRPREMSSCPSESVEKQIDVISDGPTSRGDSMAGRKAYTRAVVEKCQRQPHVPEITFPTGETK